MRLIIPTILIVSILLLCSLDLGTSYDVNVPHLEIRGIMLTDSPDNGGVFILPPGAVQYTDRGITVSSHANFKEFDNNVFLNQSILFPESTQGFPSNSFGFPLKIKDLRHHFLIYQIKYSGRTTFKFLEIIEMITGAAKVSVNQIDNFTYGDFIGDIFYNINASTGNLFFNLDLNGSLPNGKFIQIYIYENVQIWKMLILIPLSNFENFSFEQIEFTNYNMSLPESTSVYSPANSIAYPLFGILAGVAIVLVLFYYYKKKE